MAYQKPTGLTVKKFCLFMFFGIFATHLVYLGELTQIRYTAIRNKSKHYRRDPKLNFFKLCTITEKNICIKWLFLSQVFLL